jgi:hypothetical protein
MKDQLTYRMAPTRNAKRQNPWLNWLGTSRTAPVKPADFEPNFEPGTELLSVAQATLTWWEKHKNDTLVVDGQVNYRYELKPTFVTQAQEVIKRLARN